MSDAVEPAAVCAAAQRLLDSERATEPFGTRLPAAIDDLDSATSRSLMACAIAALTAPSTEAAARALFERTAAASGATVGTWEQLADDAAAWVIHRARLARGETAVLRSLRPAASAPAAPSVPAAGVDVVDKDDDVLTLW